MKRLQIELEHMLRLLQPPFTENWKRYVWAKAKEMAKEPEFAELPKLLAERMQSQPKAEAPPSEPTS